MEPIRPTITVVIPMYNAASFINRALGSVFQQAILPDEIIVVDDGSTDNSIEIVLRNFQDVKLISQKNSGVASARNTGISAASSDWIAFLDSDDFWLPNHLEVAVRVIQGFSSASVVSTGFMRWDTSTPFEVRQKSIDEREVDYFKEQVKNLGVICSSSALVRRDAFLHVGNFSNIRNHEDTDMWERLMLHFNLACSFEITSVYVITESGASNQYLKSLSSKNQDWEEVLYLSKNIDLSIGGADKKTKERYQNHLKWSNVKTLLLHDCVYLAKEKSKEIQGSTRFIERLGLMTTASCPAFILRGIVKVRNVLYVRVSRLKTRDQKVGMV